MSDDTQYGHAGRHHGIGTPDCPRELHHHHDERCERPSANREQLDTRIVRAWNAGRLDEHRALTATANLLDRRQRAREAYWDDMRGLSMRTEGIEQAIETATRVRVTPELVAVAYAALGDAAERYFPPERHMRTMIAAALAAAGFEVEE